MSVNAVLAIFLVCTFVVNGIISLWAAKSSLHWFARTTVVFGILSPLLVARALEPFVTLLLQATTIALAENVSRRVRPSRRGEPTGRNYSWRNRPIQWIKSVRVSTATILLTVGLIAILMAVGIRMPELNSNAWLSMALTGLCLGMCVLVAQIGTPERSRWRVIPVMILSGLALAIPLAWLDWFIPSLVGWAGWPPESITGIGFLGIDNESRPIVWWFVICLCVVVVMRTWNTLVSYSPVGLSETALSRFRGRFGRRALKPIVATSLFSMCLLPVYVLWVLLRPATFVSQQRLSSNAYDRIVELGSAITKSKFDGIQMDWDIVPEPKLSAALLDIRDELDALNATLQLPCRVPTNYESSELPMDTMRQLRTTARALGAEGRFAIIKGNPDVACQSFLDAIRLGVSCRSGGLVVDGLVGIGCSGVGSMQLYKHRNDFSQQACHNAASEVLSLIQQAESYEEFQVRDRAWTQATMGWHGRLQQFLFDITGSSLLFSDDDLRNRFLLEQAVMRLVAIELALRAFFIEHQTWPDLLSELVPKHLTCLPKDPFDEANGSFRYIRLNDGFQLYGLGANRADEGGKPPIEENSFLIGASLAGDLLLSQHFADGDSTEEEAMTEVEFDDGVP